MKDFDAWPELLIGLVGVVVLAGWFAGCWS